MPNVDLFHLFRWGVGWIATVYATVITVQSLYGWYVYLTATDRYTRLMRRYLLAQAVRLRIRRFGGDLLICLLLCVAFILIWKAHYALWSADDAWKRLKVDPSATEMQAASAPNDELGTMNDERQSCSAFIVHRSSLAQRIAPVS